MTYRMLYPRVNMVDRIVPDAHLLFMQMLAEPERRFIVFTDSQEYADAVMTIVERLYPGASDRLTFEVP